MRTFLKIWTIIALSFFPIYLFAQTEIAGGEVSGVWTKANSPYRINGEITIPNMQTLTIEPGVKVLFTGPYLMYTYGRILAKGIPGDSILFSSSKQGINWQGIHFNCSWEAKNDTSVFSFCILEQAKSPDIGDWDYTSGGAINIRVNSKVNIYNSVFRNNISTITGGAISVCGGGGYLMIKKCRLYENRSGTGGAVYINSSSSQIADSEFFKNSSDDSGSAINIEGTCTSKIVNNLIYNNSGSRGSVFIGGSTSPILINNTLCYNYSTYSSAGIYIENAGSVNCMNNILYQNQGSESNAQVSINNQGIEIILKYNNIQGGIKSIDISNSSFNLTENNFQFNIDVNPQFVNPSLLAGAGYDTRYSDWHLQANSLCINAGIADTSGIESITNDFFGNKRISDGRIDIGAAEYHNASGDLKADFSTSLKSSLSVPFTITYSDKSIGTPTSWNWEFGDGSISVEQNPVHSYKNFGLYTVSLAIRKGNNVNTETKYAYIKVGSVKEINSGVVEGIWDNNVVRVNGDITIPNGKTLEIKAGTKVEFAGFYKINVQGKLLAIGNKRDSIRFSSINNIVKWHGIRFIYTPSTNDSSVLNYCFIENSMATGIMNDDNVGGGIFIQSFSKIRIDNSIIQRCLSKNPGGGIFCSNSSPIIKNTKFIENIGYEGGGIQYSGCPPGTTISYCTFIRNNDDAIYCNCSYLTILNNLITNNTHGIDSYFPSGLEIINNIIYSNQRAIACGGPNINITNNTICNNKNIIYCDLVSSPILTNNIFYESKIDANTQLIYLQNKLCKPIFKNCLINEGLFIVKGDGEDYYDSSNVQDMIVQDPQFNVDPNEFNEFDFSLKPSSPCINSGLIDTTFRNIPLLDYNHNSRISDGRIDIGAYEFQDLSMNLNSDFKSSITTSDNYPISVTFTDWSNGQPNQWSWDFGDGDTSSSQHPEHLYKRPGFYTVSLTIRKGENVNTETKIKYITVATQEVIGNIYGLWDKKHYSVTGHIIIPNGKTLEIKPGTKIEFSGPFKVDVKGRLLAIGKLNDSIVFTCSNFISGKWKGIVFKNISSNNDSSKIDHCIIECCYKSNDPNEQYNKGAIYIEGNTTKAIISNSCIRNNSATIGGGIYISNSNTNIISNHIIGNSVISNGGALTIEGESTGIVRNNFVSQNYGGSIICISNTKGNLILSNNIICNNRGRHFSATSAIYCVDSNPEIINNTIAFNEGSSSLNLTSNSNIKCRNNIFYGNKGTLSYQINIEENSISEFYNNLIEGGLAGIGGNGVKNITDFSTNINTNPLFQKEPLGIGMNFSSSPEDFQFKQTSPCINTGTPDTAGLNLPQTDFFGYPRIASNYIDIGAYEYQPENDLGITAWLGKTKSCKFTDKENVTIRIKNFGSKPQSDFLVYYSINGGVSYISENVNVTIQSGDSLDYSFIQPADLKNKAVYSCLAIVKSNGDNIASNDTFKIDEISYQLSSGLKAEYHFCEGKTDTIKAISGLVSYQWTGGNSSTNYLTVSKPGTYSVLVTNDEGCVVEEKSNVTFHNLPGAPAGSDKTICEGMKTANLLATGTNIKWYNDSRLTNFIAQGNTYSPNITKKGTYPFYITQTEVVYGCTSLPDTIKLTINARPDQPLADNVNIGLGDATKNLTAEGSDIKWYSKPDGSGLLHNGNTYNPNKAVLGTYEYYVTQTVDGCESSTTKITLNILDLPSPPKTSNKTICRGRQDSKLQAEGINVNWYSDKDLKNLVGTGPEFDTGEVNAGEYNFYVTQTVNNVVSATGTVKLTIIDVPYAPEVENVTIFKGEDPRPLTATGQSVKWYTDEALTNKVFEGTEFSTGKTDAGTYTYFVTQTVNGCESPTRLVEYTLTETLNQIFTTLCEGDESIIEAPGQNVKWYADEAKANLLASGNKFSTGKTKPGDYTFYYTQTVNNTESNTAKAVLTIHPLPPKPEIMETGSSFCYEDIVKCTNYDKQYSYNWYLDETPIAGETNSEYELKKDLKGILKLVVTDLNTKCLNSSKEFSVSSFIPEIVLKGDNILICKNLNNDYKAWQWFRHNQKIENATYQFYEAKQPGEYFTEATNTINCNLKSNKISMLQVASLNLYPTINKGTFNLEIQNAKTEQLNLKIYSIFGLKVNETNLENRPGAQNLPVSIKGLQPGVYMVEIVLKEKKFMKRMVVEY